MFFSSTSSAAQNTERMQTAVPNRRAGLDRAPHPVRARTKAIAQTVPKIMHSHSGIEMSPRPRLKDWNRPAASGTQARIVKFKETGRSARLKLFNPMFNAKAKANNVTTVQWRALIRDGDRRRNEVELSEPIPVITFQNEKPEKSAHATSCWIPVIRNAAGTP
mmetsp:Transcript_84551/g.167860  ORF Transcript_84551/g.167860 Transcript_84551/m.167860 type:complete len:163 (+) Transcript_84551:481-969(+)